MTCYSPLKGWRSKSVNTSGKRPIVFVRSAGFVDMPVEVPCGQCIGCRLEYSRQWAIRCVHEAQLHEDNAFITLTYSDQYLPDDHSLNLKHFQKFMKRLRKSLDNKIRFFHCGEYGDLSGRPHYHALIFGHSFPDKKPWKTINDFTLHRSASLENLWTFGYSSIGEITFQSAAYCARYLLKKINGENSKTHYQYINPETGLITQRKPEYTTQSRRPGLATGWFKKYETDVFPSDFVILNGAKMRPPKFYDGLYELQSPREHKKIKSNRKADAKKHADDQTPERLKVRCQVQKSQINLLPRKIE